MIAADLGDGIVLRQIADRDDAEEWAAAFTGAYQTIFSGYPYFERWNPDEALGIWRKLNGLPHHLSLIATRGSVVVGFGIAIPLAGKRDVAQMLSGLLPIPHTFYLAELGVLPEYRNRELGRTLVRERLRRIDPERWTHVCLRTPMGHAPSTQMYLSLGFEDMGVAMDVEMMRVDGRVTTDRRRFLARVLSQVALDG